MEDIIRQFNDNRQTKDLFQSWQNEVRLRNNLRTCASTITGVKNLDQALLDFFYRSLYWTNREQFFNILFANMQNIVVYKWLQSFPDLAREFLADLPYRIMTEQPDFRALQFLVNIYRQEFQDEFVRIVNVLSLPVCEELLKRTASPNLRNLLRQRLARLQKQPNVLAYGINAVKRGDSYPALYGDKLQLLLKAAKSLNQSQPYNSLGACQSARLSGQLEAAAAVLEAGLVEDSLAILADAYLVYLDCNREVDMDKEAQLYNMLYRSLRRVIPVYALLEKPNAPFVKAVSCYRNYFGLVSPEPASLEYLKIYELVREGLAQPDPDIITEIYLKTAVIENYRPDDAFLQSLHNWACEQPAVPGKDVYHTAVQRMQALPHEGFIILEFLRLAEKCCPGTIKGLNLLQDYMELWKWIPSPLFLNQALIQELSFDNATRRQAEKMIDPTGRSNPNFMNFFAQCYREVWH
jgi:hypothetical protein